MLQTIVTSGVNGSNTISQILTCIIFSRLKIEKGWYRYCVRNTYHCSSYARVRGETQ